MKTKTPKLQDPELARLLTTPVIQFRKDKDCKHSVRFAAVDPNAAVQSLYVNRLMAGNSTTAEITLLGK